MMRSDLVLVRWSAWSLRNQIRSIRASYGTFDLLTFTGACLLLGAYLASRLDAVLIRQSAVVHAHWPLFISAMAGLAAVAGAAAGWGACRRALRRASATWMAVLPMPRTIRSRAVTLAALAALPWQTLLAGLPAAWVGARTGDGTPALHALALAGIFATAFTATVFCSRLWQSRAASGITAHLDGAASRNGKRPHWIHWLRRVDAARPCWIGVWDYGQRRSFVMLAVFAVFGTVSATASLLQGWCLPALSIGIIGGNLVFVSVLRGTPLRSPICRTAPLGFVPAWAALTRLPLALSAVCFLPLAAVGAAAQHGGLETATAGALALLGGNLVYAVLIAFSPASPVFTMTVYAGVLATAAVETLELSQSIVLVLAAFLAFLWWLGRRSYRGG